MIADAERSIALAGIMGGEETEISDSDRPSVLLEAANFEPTGLWRTSERLRLRTEGSNRWEKGVDPYLAEQAAALGDRADRRADRRALGRAHGRARPSCPSGPSSASGPSGRARSSGSRSPAEEQHDDPRRGSASSARDGEYVVPTWRARDLTREVDLVEEVARFRLADVPFTLPVRREMAGRLTPRAAASAAGSRTRSPRSASPRCTRRRSSSDDASRDALRLPGADHRRARGAADGAPARRLVEAARRNAEVGNERVALFEVARVYLPRGTTSCPTSGSASPGSLEGGFLRSEGRRRGAAPRAPRATPTWSRAQHPLLHPGKAARDRGRASSASCTPRSSTAPGAPSSSTSSSSPLPARDPVPYEDVITYPAVHQDIAFAVAEDVEVGALVDAAREAAGPVLREARVFDVYRGEQVGEGRKSVAIHLSFQSPERTLTDEDAAELRRDRRRARRAVRRRAPRVDPLSVARRSSSMTASVARSDAGGRLRRGVRPPRV